MSNAGPALEPTRGGGLTKAIGPTAGGGAVEGLNTNLAPPGGSARRARQGGSGEDYRPLLRSGSRARRRTCWDPIITRGVASRRYPRTFLLLLPVLLRPGAQRLRVPVPPPPHRVPAYWPMSAFFFCQRRSTALSESPALRTLPASATVLYCPVYTPFSSKCAMLICFGFVSPRPPPAAAASAHLHRLVVAAVDDVVRPAARGPSRQSRSHSRHRRSLRPRRPGSLGRFPRPVCLRAPAGRGRGGGGEGGWAGPREACAPPARHPEGLRAPSPSPLRVAKREALPGSRKSSSPPRGGRPGKAGGAVRVPGPGRRPPTGLPASQPGL